MRSRLNILATTVFIAGHLFSGCDMLNENTTTSQDFVLEAKNVVADPKSELNQAFELFKLKSDYAIATNELRIRELKFKSIAEKDEHRFNGVVGKDENNAIYDKQVAALESKNAELKMKLTNYIEDNNWEAFKAEFNQEMNDLGKEFADLAVNNVN